MICDSCKLKKSSEHFWDTHQTMSDLTVWCANSTKRVDEMTRAIVNKYKAEVKQKFGNKKRHNQ